MEPAFLKERRKKQLSLLRDFVSEWLELGDLLEPGKDSSRLHALRRKLAELAQLSVYSLPDEAKKKTREITDFLAGLSRANYSSELFQSELVRDWHAILIGLYRAEGWINKENYKDRKALAENTLNDWLKLYDLTRHERNEKEKGILIRQLANEFAAIEYAADSGIDYEDALLAAGTPRKEAGGASFTELWERTYCRLLDMLGTVTGEEEYRKDAKPIPLISKLVSECDDLGEKMNKGAVGSPDIIRFKGYIWGKYRKLMENVFFTPHPGRPDVLQTNDAGSVQIDINGIVEMLQNAGESIAREISAKRQKVLRRRKQKILAFAKPLIVLAVVGIPLKMLHDAGYDIRDYFGRKAGAVQVKTFEEMLAGWGRAEDERFISSWQEKWQLIGDVPANSLRIEDEYIYVGDLAGNIRVYDRLLGQWDRPVKLPFDEPVRCMAGAGGDLFLGTAWGIYKGETDKGRIRNVRKISEDVKNVNCLYIKGNTLWFGTDEGAGSMATGGGKINTIIEGLPDRRVTALGSDGRHLWLGTAKGAAYIPLGEPGMRVRRLEAEAYITSIVCGEEEVWFGGAGKIYRYIAGAGSWHAISLGDSPGFWVKDIALSGDVLWISTQGEGVIKYNTGHSLWKNYFTEELSGSSILSAGRSLWFHRGDFSGGKIVECVLPEEAFVADRGKDEEENSAN